MAGVRSFGVGPVWVQFDMFGEEPLIYTSVPDAVTARRLQSYLRTEVDRIVCSTPAAADGLPPESEGSLGWPVQVSVHDEVDGQAHLMIGGPGRRRGKTRPPATDGGAA